MQGRIREDVLRRVVTSLWGHSCSGVTFSKASIVGTVLEVISCLLLSGGIEYRAQIDNFLYPGLLCLR